MNDDKKIDHLSKPKGCSVNNAPKNVLVLGDLMLDQAWIISSRAQETSQAHDDVRPRTRSYPKHRDLRLGGAGLIANSLREVFRELAGKPPIIHLLGNCAKNDETVFEENGLFGKPPKTSDAEAPPLKFHRLETSDFTIKKLRMYEKLPGHPPELKLRFDQDPPAGIRNGGKTESAEVKLPHSLNGIHFDAIVVSSNKKGTVTESLLKSVFAKCDTQKPVFIDCKDAWLLHNSDVLRDLNDVTLFPNRHEAARLWQEVYGPEKNVRLLDMPHHIAKRDIIEMGHDLVSRFAPWKIVIKVDRDGAYVFKRRDLKVSFWHANVDDLNYDSVGAGDIFLARWVVEFLHDQRCVCHLLQTSNSWARAWVEWANELFWNEEESSPEVFKPHIFKNVRSDIPSPNFEVLKDVVAEAKKQKKELEPSCATGTLGEVDQIDRQSRFPDLLTPEKRINFENARGWLKGFLTTDRQLGQKIVSFAREVREYRRATDRRRPLNCLIWAPPGSGKSFLVKELAHELDAKLHEVNVAQFTSVDGLISGLAAVSSQMRENDLLMIDEVDSQFAGGSFCFPQLLSLLWEGVLRFGNTMWCFPRFVSILVTSWSCEDGKKSAGDFIHALRNHDLFQKQKGPDLASRINGSVLTLDVLSKADRVYLAARCLRDRFKELSCVERNVIDFLAHGELSSRELEYFVETLPQPVDGRICTEEVLARLRADNASLMNRFGIPLEHLKLLQSPTRTDDERWIYITTER